EPKNTDTSFSFNIPSSRLSFYEIHVQPFSENVSHQSLNYAPCVLPLSESDSYTTSSVLITDCSNLVQYHLHGTAANLGNGQMKFFHILHDVPHSLSRRLT